FLSLAPGTAGIIRIVIGLTSGRRPGERKKKTEMKRRRVHGFTLVEMLVIIAVVMLLAVLFFPGGCPSRPAARTASCLSNLKQIGLGLSMYTQDYDGVLPWNPAPGGLPAGSWAPAF